MGRAGIGLAVLAAVGIAGAAFWVLPRMEGEAPQVQAPEQILLGAASQSVTIGLADAGAGLRLASVQLVHAGGSSTLHEAQYPGSWLRGGAEGSQGASVVLDLAAKRLGLADGAASLVVSVRDWSWREGLEGNRSEISIPISIDTRPPQVSSLASGLTYVQRGGAGAVVYRVDADAKQDGVRVGDVFFQGYAHAAAGEGGRAAIFAIPIDAAPKPVVEIVASDATGNETRVRFAAQILERSFAERPIQIDEGFLSRVAVPLAAAANLDAPDPVAAFRVVNEQLRASNEARMRELLRESSPQRLWSGAFAQLANSQVMSRFAEHRSYLFNGEKLSQARHYGYDLASTAAADVTSAARGTVVYAGDLGIYGNCILVDHGLGVTTVYGHLSSLGVNAGQSVEQGERLGQSGATGFAGGDHLHFAILVGGVYVDPVEWWDTKWVRSHIEARLEP